MSQDFPPSSSNILIADSRQFVEWSPLNDTIMGGSSKAGCRVTEEGLFLEGLVVEEGGGFVSCRSPILSPPIDLSKFVGLQILVDGSGRTLKIALASKNRISGFAEFFNGGLRWVASIPTEESGTTSIQIPFTSFQPTVRANRVSIPFKIDLTAISQFQLLHSKFGKPGELNSGFKAGTIKILLRSISAYN